MESESETGIKSNEDTSNQNFELSKTSVLAPISTNEDDDLSWENEILDSDEENDVLEAFGSTFSMEDTAKRPAKVPKVIQDWRELGAKHHRQIARRRRLQLYHSNNNKLHGTSVAGCHDDEHEERPSSRSVQLLFKAPEAKAASQKERKRNEKLRQDQYHDYSNKYDKDGDKIEAGCCHGYRESEPERSRRRGSDP